MGESIYQSPHGQSMDPGCSPPVGLAKDAMPFNFTQMLQDAYDEKLTGAQLNRLSKVIQETDTKELTAEQRYLIYLRAFKMVLASEGLRSPDYYRDKSQCLSFWDCSPGEKAIYKVRALAKGYIEPKELIKRLKKLKRSNNFTLPKFGHPVMEWYKSPIIEKCRIISPPDPDWLVQVLYRFDCLRLQRRLGQHQHRISMAEICEYWKKVSDIGLTPLPDLHFLKDMGHSPSGTLLPRSLVKGLHELRECADCRGTDYYREEYGKAKVKREETIRRWQDKHPESILADDPFYFYKTWPAELMTQLNGLDQAALACGNKCYIADLLTTEKEMQKLFSFWKECGLITGTRTPISPKWPDPQAKVRNLDWPQYLSDKHQAIFREFGHGKESYKRERFEIARWKEAVINTDTDPATAEIPMSPSLWKELEVAWRGYENQFDLSDVESDMIGRIGERRKLKRKTTLASEKPTFQTDADLDTEDIMDKKKPENPPMKISRSDSIGLKEASYFLRTMPRKRTQSRSAGLKPTAKETIWSSRLRPKAAPENSSRPQLKASKNPSERPQGVLKLGSKQSSQKPQQIRSKSPHSRSFKYL